MAQPSFSEKSASPIGLPGKSSLEKSTEFD
jgi:hypothetical protein